jgi:plastocyanin
MNTKMFLSLLAAGSFCVVAPAQAQQTESKKTAGAQTATKQTAGKANKQAAGTSTKAADKTAKAGAKPSGQQHKVDVVIGSMSLSPNKLDVPAGSVMVDIRNNSEKPHLMVLEGGTMKKVEANVAVGGSGSITGVLEPGTYTLRCQMGGHMESGAKLTVK